MAVVIGKDVNPQYRVLSFEKDLSHAFVPLSARLEQGVTLLEDLTTMVRLRIDSESSLVRGLQKVMQRVESSEESESGTIKDSLDAIKADVKNEYTAKNEYVNSLHDDVYKPLTQFKDQYTRASRQYAQTAKQLLQSLRDVETKYYKTRSKYEKAIREAELARTQLQATKKEYGLSAPQVNKMGSKVDVAMQSQQQWKTRYDEEQQNLLREKDRFRDEMAVVLRGMELNELSRLQTVGDCLRKWAVFTTNLCANRNYDIQALAQIMSVVKPEEDLQSFMRETLVKYPASSINAKMADELLGYELGSSFSRHSFSTSLTVESKSVDGSILGHHELVNNQIDIDTSNLKNPPATNETTANSATNTDEPRTNSGSLSKLFTGLKLSKRLLEQVTPQSMTFYKADDSSLISNESNRSHSVSSAGSSIQSQPSGVNAIKRPRTMKKPRRLIYEPQIKSVDESKNSGDTNENSQSSNSTQNNSKNSKLVEEPRPSIPPPRPPAVDAPLPPLLDTQESDELSCENINKESNIPNSSEIESNVLSHNNNNNNNNPNDNNNNNNNNNNNTNNPSDDKNQQPTVPGGSSMSSVLDPEIATPKNVDIPDEPTLHHTRSVASTASTPTLSGVDSQFDWAPRSPYV